MRPGPAAVAAAQGGMDPNGVEMAETAETVKAGTQPLTLVKTLVEVQQAGNPMVAEAALAVRTEIMEPVVVLVLILTIPGVDGGDPPEMAEVEELLVQP